MESIIHGNVQYVRRKYISRPINQST